ncbi:hypothetical protein HK100_009673 [Physocladia obscura]|uniref:Uncharacterized protein n=1 Tax=Physocladia obscura TaxID=109957 RepID=A0AAD5T4U3_9FUNG|nr:hypothetical protein HK100_009673 [Physocladia obscura]
MARRPTNVDDLLRDLDDSLSEFSEIARTEAADETAPVPAKKSVINEQINATIDNANDEDDSAYDLLDSYGDDKPETTVNQAPVIVTTPVPLAVNSTVVYGVRPPRPFPLPAHSQASAPLPMACQPSASQQQQQQQQQLSPSQIYLQQQLRQRQQLPQNAIPQQYQQQQLQLPTSGGFTSNSTSASVRNVQPPNFSHTPNLARMNSNSESIHNNQSLCAAVIGGFLSGDQIRHESAATATVQSDTASFGGRRGSDATYNTNTSVGDDVAQDKMRKLREQLERTKMELQDQLEMNKKNEFQGAHKDMEYSQKDKSGDTSSVNSKTSGKVQVDGSQSRSAKPTAANSTAAAATTTENKLDENGKPVVVKKKKKDDRLLMVMIDF